MRAFSHQSYLVQFGWTLCSCTPPARIVWAGVDVAAECAEESKTARELWELCRKNVASQTSSAAVCLWYESKSDLNSTQAHRTQCTAGASQLVLPAALCIVHYYHCVHSIWAPVCFQSSVTNSLSSTTTKKITNWKLLNVHFVESLWFGFCVLPVRNQTKPTPGLHTTSIRLSRTKANKPQSWNLAGTNSD